MRAIVLSLQKNLATVLAAVCLAGFITDDAHAQNVAPVISGSPALTAAAGALYDFTPTASDADGDYLAFGVSGLPRWATFDKNTGRLYGRPSPRDIGSTRTITIAVSDGKLSAALPSFKITIKAGSSPTIGGSPGTSVSEGSAYFFAPTASDPEGDKLTFSISGKPAWASFSRRNGQLSGTPAVGTAGTYSNIRISVSDGATIASLPLFSITVTQATSQANRAPMISGSPATSVETGQTYLFVPTATEPDGQSLTFAVANRPAWAAFNSATGQLSGTPIATDVGTYSNIVISATDGITSASLPAFSILVKDAVVTGAATLSWQPPVENVDGTPLTNLAGYRIRYGQSSSSLDQLVEIPNAGITSTMIESLAGGTWYFALKAYTTANVESDLSNVVQKLIN